MNHRTTTIHTHFLNLPPRSSIRTYQILITYSLDRLHDLYFVLSSIISSVLFFDLSTSASHTYLSFCLTNYLYTTPYSTLQTTDIKTIQTKWSTLSTSFSSSYPTTYPSTVQTTFFATYDGTYQSTFIPTNETTC